MKHLHFLRHAVACAGVAMLVAACGGGGGDPGTNPRDNNSGGGTTARSASSVDVYSSAASIPTGGAGAAITITAIVKDSGNVAIPNFPVAFKTEYGSLSPVTKTNDKGIATAELTPPKTDNALNRSFGVTVTAKGASKKIDLKVEGTTVALSGDTSLGVNQEGEYTVNVRDAAGETVSNAGVTITAQQGGSQAQVASVQTGSNGIATFKYKPTAAGSVRLVADGLNAENTSRYLDISVGSAVIQLTTESPYWRLNQANRVVVRVADGNQSPVAAGTKVLFSTTRGCIVDAGDTACTTSSRTAPVSSKIIETNAAGYAEGFVLSTDAGATSIKAEVTSGSLQGIGTLTAQFIALVPSRLIVQANPNALQTSAAASGNSAVIDALLLDDRGNPVINMPVYFTVLNDLSGGRLAATSVKTNEQGRAKNTFYAGPRGTGSDQVIIRAALGGDYSGISDEVRLTVGGDGLSIALGDSTLIASINGDTMYRTMHTAYVTNSAGVSQASVPVTLRIEPFAYSQGLRCWNGKVWAVTRPKVCQAVDSNGRCIREIEVIYTNEDANFNGIRDANELNNVSDVLGLKPGFVATLIPAKSDGTVVAAGGSTITVTTDSNGLAYFYTQYAKRYAGWAAMRIVATAQAGGSDSRNATPGEFLAALLSDVNEEKKLPPGAISPYGVGQASCAVATPTPSPTP